MADASSNADSNSFVPGAMVAYRYRLLAPHGRGPRLVFWHAFDTWRGCDVALTIVDPDRHLPEEFVHEILARTVRLRGLDTVGIAQILDVAHTGHCGLVGCEWIRGADLAQVAATRPAPAGVASAMQSLAAAAESAHRSGLVLSVDSLDRLRFSVEGSAVLAFPAVLPEATPQSDLRGIGSAMEAVLAGNPEIPYLTSATLTGLLRDNDGITSAATLLTLLREAASGTADVDDSTGRVMAPLPAPPPGQYASFRNFGPAEQKDAARRHILRAGLAAAAAIIVAAVTALASSLNGLLAPDDSQAAMDADKLGLVPKSTAPAVPAPSARPAPGPGESVVLASAAVFSPEGSPDSPESAGLVIDDKPDTAWSTDRYYDSDPFPTFKPGVGLLVRLRDPAPVSAVTVDVDSVGTAVQIRSAESDAPGSLADTAELTSAVPTQLGQNRIPVDSGGPVTQVLVWISTLGSTEGENRAAVAEIDVHAASPPA
ncbi:protein kinase family protein [Mycolicibacterium thermoresistibile]